MARKAETTYTFAVTFKAPSGASVRSGRDFLLNAIASEVCALNPDDVYKSLDPKTLKVHLTNKEVKYG